MKDGHESANPNISEEQVAKTDFNTINNSNFIKGHTDWLKSGVDDNGSERRDNWSKTDGTFVCPVGFRVPLKTEMIKETKAFSKKTKESAFNSFLKVGAGGDQNHSTGRFIRHGVTASLWIISKDKVEFITTDKNGSFIPNIFAQGVSVRCIKD